MEDQRKDIIDDMTYSRRIQNAIMPSKEYISILFHECFLFNRPKRIVSGDFYWISFKENKAILAVADCTGHGSTAQPRCLCTADATQWLDAAANHTVNITIACRSGRLCYGARRDCGSRIRLHGDHADYSCPFPPVIGIRCSRCSPSATRYDDAVVTIQRRWPFRLRQTERGYRLYDTTDSLRYIGLHAATAVSASVQWN